MLKKGLKQVGDVHRHACLHPYFNLMCNSTTYHLRKSSVWLGILISVTKLSLALLFLKPNVSTAFQQSSSLTGTKTYESDLYMYNSMARALSPLVGKTAYQVYCQVQPTPCHLSPHRCTTSLNFWQEPCLHL